MPCCPPLAGKFFRPDSGVTGAREEARKTTQYQAPETDRQVPQPANDRGDPAGSKVEALDSSVITDLPLIELPASDGATDTLAVIVSGDGGWAGLDKSVSRALGATMAALSSPSGTKTPAETAKPVPLMNCLREKPFDGLSSLRVLPSAASSGWIELGRSSLSGMRVPPKGSGR